MLTGALLIHLSGGRIETHFHVFGSLAFLAFYRDWKVLVPATVVVALDHMLRGYFWPQSVYGVVVASQWRWIEHAAWVLFEDIFLIVSCRRSVLEMQQTAERTAALEQEVRIRHEAEQEARIAHARNDAILQVALDCVILMDASGRIVQFNPAAERTFGCSAPEAVGRQLGEFIIPQSSEETTILNRRLELMAIRNGDERFPVEVAFAPISSDGSAMFAGYLRDITDRRRTETALADYTRELEQATRAKSDFLASMSHELRTPLNAIILYSELLQELAPGRGDQDSIPDLQRIQSAGKHLLELINDILDLSKIEAGKMALSVEEFDVTSLVDEMLDTVGPLVQKNRNTLAVHCAPDVGTMTTDAMKTRQILLNLLSNASKFTHDGVISLTASRRTVDGTPCVEFTVTDTGVGMTSQQMSKIFDAFTQADVTTSRKYGGTGLGLALVSRFCQMMGGRVSVESRPGPGLAFYGASAGGDCGGRQSARLDRRCGLSLSLER